MIDSQYYNSHLGPDIIKCIYDNKDYTQEIQHYYGLMNNWNGKLYKYSEIFGDDCRNKSFYIEYMKEDKLHKNWIYNYITDKDQYYHPKLFV